MPSLFRFTVFFSDGDCPLDGPSEFEKFFGFPHKEIVETVPGIAVQYKKIDSKVVSEVVVSPSKIDFLIHGVFQLSVNVGPDQPAEFQLNQDRAIVPQLEQEPFRSQISDFIRRDHPKSIVRLALGVDYQMIVANREAGYEALDRKLHSVNLNPKISNEFLYRINYPEVLAVDDDSVPLNRLTMWTCAGINFEVTPDDAERVKKTFFSARVSGDFNTSPVFDISKLGIDSQIKLIDCFFEYANHLATQGEFS
jgi:hypothetical protein